MKKQDPPQMNQEKLDKRAAALRANLKKRKKPTRIKDSESGKSLPEGDSTDNS